MLSYEWLQDFDYYKAACMYVWMSHFFLIEGGPESLVNKLGNEDVPTLRLHVMFENV